VSSLVRLRVAVDRAIWPLLGDPNGGIALPVMWPAKRARRCTAVSSDRHNTGGVRDLRCSEQSLYSLLVRVVELRGHPGRGALRDRDHSLVTAARSLLGG
jgi:hypothetical protein